MPKRTNQFQKLVFTIQTSLSDNGEVTESKMLKEVLTGIEREVDIVIEDNISGVDVIVSIEANYRGKRVDVTYVEQLAKKHETLPTNKLVIVSNKGLSKNAEIKARSLNIDTISFDEANKTDWTFYLETLQNVSIGLFEFKILEGHLDYKMKIGGSKELKLWENVFIYLDEGKKPTLFLDYILSRLNHDIGKEVMRQWIKKPKSKKKNKFKFNVTIEFNTEPIVEMEKTKYLAKRMNLEVAARVISTKLEMQNKKYLSSNVAYGFAKNIFVENESRQDDVIVAITQDEKGKLKGNIFIPKEGYDKGDQYSLDMEDF